MTTYFINHILNNYFSADCEEADCFYNEVDPWNDDLTNLCILAGACGTLLVLAFSFYQCARCRVRHYNGYEAI